LFALKNKYKLVLNEQFMRVDNNSNPITSQIPSQIRGNDIGLGSISSLPEAKLIILSFSKAEHHLN